MHRRYLLTLGAAAIAMTLAGCTSFTPVYGDRSGAAAMRFHFSPPTNRLEQVILNRLQTAFPGPAAPGDPVLRVSASASLPSAPLSDPFVVSTPTNVRVDASVTISQGDSVLFSAARFADSAYQGRKLAPTNAASAEGARETAAEAAAESLRAAILAGYRPVSTPPR